MQTTLTAPSGLMTERPSPSLQEFAAARLAQLDTQGIRRQLTPTRRLAPGQTSRGDRTLISFCDNDYLGLAMDRRVVQAAAEAAQAYGAGSGASRLVTGDCPLNAQLEAALARMKNAPAARVFGSGYLANIGAAPVLVGAGDLIVMDELSHACMHAGSALSGANVCMFPHNDVAQARQLLSNRPANARGLLLTETVFSMDGDLAPLSDLHAVCRETGSWLMTDDAHGFGVVDIDNPADVQMGTLSKAIGGYGGYVAGPEAFIDLLTSRARSFIYTTGLPPAVLGAALAALEIIEAEPDLGGRALERARLFCELTGLPAPRSAIVPLILGDTKRAMRASNHILEQGFLVTAIRPPTVPQGGARLRFTFSAAHEEQDVRRLAMAVRGLTATDGSSS